MDLLILDVSLPDTNGFALYMEIQSEKKYTHLPIIFLTSQDQSSEKVTGLSLGTDDYITKPFDQMELRARVSLRLNKAQKQKSSNLVIIKKDLHFA